MHTQGPNLIKQVFGATSDRIFYNFVQSFNCILIKTEENHSSVTTSHKGIASF